MLKILYKQKYYIFRKGKTKGQMIAAVSKLTEKQHHKVAVYMQTID